MSEELGTTLPVVLVLAVADNGVIGRGNALPWDLPDDLQNFKKITMGRPILMGRKTYESIGRPLPGRLNIVITRDRDWFTPGVTIVHSLEKAFEVAEQRALLDGADALMVIGGAEVYRSAISKADRIVMTRVHGEVSGDAYFDLDSVANWSEQARVDFSAAGRNSHDFSVIDLIPPEVN